ncbi:MAG: MFS transporter [Cyanobacteria bacterium SW_4_48_29]|nr:MAG: MFS transporter [Cyanobacteria bacterium QH_10_48_56]PSP28961.1 MAG: MFS transporter [Cyanobacteria bacterium SW_4_48_29]
MKIFRSLEPQQRKSLLALFLAGLSFWISLTSLLPTLPAYIEDVGGTKQQVGLVMGSFAIGLLLFRSVLGRLADRRSRKLVVLIGTVVVGIAPLGYLFVESIPLLMVIRAFHGISIAAFTTGYSALVVDQSPPEQKGELIGYMSLVVPVGLAIGPAVGGFLQAGVGYMALFLTSASVGILGLIFATQVGKASREKPASHQEAGSPQSSRFWQLLASPRLRVPATVLLLIGLAFGTISTFLPLFIRAIAIDLNPGLYYSTAAIASFSVRIFVGRASDRYGRGLFITASLFCYVLAMLLLATAESPGAFLVAGLVQGAGGGTLIPIMIALISDRSAENERGKIYSLCIGGFDLGIAIAGPVIGSFANPLGYRGLFFLAMSLTSLALMVFVTLSSKDLSHSLRFATGREKDIYALKQPPQKS